jgi:hypothetical protein
MEGDTHIFWRAGRLALLAGAALTLGGCVAIEAVEPGAGAAINPDSSAGPAVAAAINDPGPWPTFANIPQLPDDLRTPEAWRDAVADQEADRLFTERNVAADTWSLSGTEAFAAGLRATVAEVDVHAPTDAEMAESEAYARALRARATPPPLPR